MSVKILWVEDINKFDLCTEGEGGHWYRKDLAPGSAGWGDCQIEGHQCVLHFVCPSGCGKLCHVNVKHEGSWTWDDNKTEPTLTPSIRMLTGCQWHGYLTKGVFTSC